MPKFTSAEIDQIVRGAWEELKPQIECQMAESVDSKSIDCFWVGVALRGTNTDDSVFLTLSEREITDTIFALIKQSLNIFGGASCLGGINFSTPQHLEDGTELYQKNDSGEHAVVVIYTAGSGNQEQFAKMIQSQIGIVLEKQPEPV